MVLCDAFVWSVERASGQEVLQSYEGLWLCKAWFVSYESPGKCLDLSEVGCGRLITLGVINQL